MSHANKISIKRVLAMILSVMMIFSMLPIGTLQVFAMANSELVTDIETKIFTVNEAAEFTFTTTANDDAGTMVIGAFEFSDPSAIEKLEYLESKDGNWYEFNGTFGPETGFPLIDGTSTFRATFNKIGTYTVDAKMQAVDDSRILCTTTATVTVTGKASELTTNIESKNFIVGESSEFTFTTVSNNDAGTMVIGAFEFSDPSAIEKLEYLESKDGNWYEFNGTFGPETGFPLIDATSTFRATFNKIGTYTVDAKMQAVDDSRILCTTTATVTVTGKASELTTDIASKNFIVGESSEFTFTTVSNNDAGTMVLGSFEFSDPSAIEKLEYLESKDGNWYEFSGDFGPVDTGFPMIDGTSTFRATFNKAGDYTVTASMKKFDGGEVLCSCVADVKVGKADITGITIAPTINKYTGSDFALLTLNGELKDGDIVSYTINDDTKSYDSIPEASAVGEYVVTIEINRGSNYNVYTQTVTSRIDLGNLELGNINVQGLEGIYTGEAQNVVSVTGQGDYSLQYKIDDGEWSDTIPTVINAGSYTVLVKATKINYNDKEVDVDKAPSAVYPFNVYIAKAEQTGFEFVEKTPAPLAYNEIFENKAEGGQSDGQITYEVIDGNEYVSVDNAGIITAKKAGGSAIIKATRAGNDNYNEVSTTYEISTIKADQTVFAFEQDAYSVQYGTDKLTVETTGGQSNGTITYEVVNSDIGSIASAENKGNITFNSGKKGTMTIKATLAGGENYNDITAEATVEVKVNDFSNKYSVDTVPSTGWYTDTVKIAPFNGYMISTSGQFEAEWMNNITIATEGKNTPDAIYLKETATGYISEAITVDDIYIDKTNPTALNITYSTSIADVVLENISFGFYNAEMTVTLTATDLVSKIDHLVYKVGDGEEVTINKAEITFSGDNGEVATGSFKIPANLSRSEITLTAYDAAGRNTTITGDKTLIVDDVKPVVSVSYDNNDAAHGSYFKEFEAGIPTRTATITIAEENFFKDDLYKEVYINDAEGNPVAQGYNYLTITIGRRLNNETDYTYTNVQPAFTKDGDVYRATVEFTEDADYTFDIAYYDYSMNKNVSVDYGSSVAPTAFTVDNTAPVLDIGYDDTEAIPSETNEGYFAGKRIAIFKVTEHNFDPSELVFTVFTATNIQNEPVNTELMEAYINELKDIEEWDHNGDEYINEIEIYADGNYAFELDYNDLANNAAEKETSSFCLDNTKPYVVTDAEISYSASVLDTILNAITFGFYDVEMEVTITAYDETAGIDFFTYSYNVDYSNDKNGHEDEVGHKNDEGKANVVIPNSEIIFSEKGKKATATFRIPEQFRGYVSFTATDKSNNTSDLFTDDKSIVVDSEAAEVSVTYDNNNFENDNYYDADRTATISISADNFFADYLYTSVMKNDQNGNPVAQGENYLVITVGKRLDTEEDFSYTDVEPVFVKDGDVYKTTVDFKENADYTFDIKYTDKSLNVYDSYPMDEFIVDKTSPTVKVVFTEPDHSNGNQYRDDRSATITIVEHNFDPKDVVATVTAQDAQGEVFNYAEYLTQKENWNSIGDTHTATVPFSTEAHYTFDIAYKDLAGNEAADYEAVEFTIDKTAPTEMDIQIDNKTVAGSMETLVFNEFYDAAVTVKLSANCDISGLESFKYQKVASISEYDEDGTWTDYNAETGIVVSPSEKFIIYFRAEDRAGNVSIIRSTGIVVDNQKPIGETRAPEIDILPDGPNENNLHRGNVNVGLKVIDPKYTGDEATANGHYSGLNKITYRIYTTDTSAVNEGTLLDVTNGVTGGAVYDDDKLINSWSGSIVIDSAVFNSNNVIVEITATDNAGNSRTSTTQAGEIRIDVTAPVINISYNNNEVDSERIFKADRIATIVITERNFKPEDVQISLTNTDGVIPTLSDWSRSGGSGNQDDTNWSATITYSADGDYEFGISYTDMAGNACASISYGNDIAPTAFTIDKTIPVITVNYDNQNVKNGNYYKDDRTATIVVTEHNFSADRVTISLAATDDGAATALPSISRWITNGDKHTATIYYGNDAKYTFDIAMSDMAGNVSAEYTEETFFVDKTAPTLTITGVENNSANNGDVIPVVSYFDTNYDANQVSITLSGANRKDVKLDGTYGNIHNGRTFTFNNFAVEKEIDDIYTLTATLTDKAGNESTETIIFSVNRFGSTYAMSETTEALNGTYVQKPIDVVITEINADELTNIKITLFKNNETIVLTEGEDYKIDVEGGNGQWYQYTYTVFAENFEDDGVYRLTFHSEDSAGNVAENTLDTKETEISFGVDKTKPNIVVANLESGVTYALENLSVEMSANDNFMLTSVAIYLDDYNNAYKTWTHEELAAIIAENGEFIFDIAGDSKGAHNVKIVCVDAAGNEQIEEITDFYVTTDIFVRYYNNKPLFFGSIAGVILVAGLMVFLVTYKKKKNEADK